MKKESFSQPIMAKRDGRGFQSGFPMPAKKARLDVTITPPQNVAAHNGGFGIDDVWGDDFDQDAIEEIDKIASQVCPQITDSPLKEKASSAVSNPRVICGISKPSTSYSIPNGSSFSLRSDARQSSNCTNSNNGSSSISPNFQYLSSSEEMMPTVKPKVISKLSQNPAVSQQPSFYGVQKPSPNASQRKPGDSSIGSRFQSPVSPRLSSSDNKTTMHKADVSFNAFRRNLQPVNTRASTFCSTQNTILVSDDSDEREREKLKAENEKLLENCITKNGEVAFLRNKLQQIQMRANSEIAERARTMEEQAGQYRSEIENKIKEAEKLKTQLRFKDLELENAQKRCKLFENGSIKLTEPHTVTFGSPSRSRLNTTLNRLSSAVKTVKLTETSVQTDIDRLSWSVLKCHIEYYPLKRIPQSIFDHSLPETSVVDIQIIEKIGKSNLPILQDEETFRIFENPDLVKPAVTMVDDRKLTVEFFLPELDTLKMLTAKEINYESTVPLINKLVATARELLLNSTVVLQTIRRAMRNDDIRDMNDIYFSDFYNMPYDCTKCLCDSRPWYESERGIESRRAIAVLSYVARESDYLSGFVAGMRSLNTSNDSHYKLYNRQMRSYNSWAERDSKFQMLELVLQFVTVVRKVKRAHQFSGLINAIIRLLCNVRKRVSFCDRGLEYIFNIFKEIVFSRPLLYCYISITDFMRAFGDSASFSQKLCIFSDAKVITLWKEALHFTMDACVMQIYIAQMQFYKHDPVTTIHLVYSLVCFLHDALVSNSIPWMVKPQGACQCGVKLMSTTLKLLYRCTMINVDTSEGVEGAKDGRMVEASMSIDRGSLSQDLRIRLKHKQLITIRKGVRFMGYLAAKDQEIITRLVDILDSFQLFEERVQTFNDLRLNESNQEALRRAKLAFVFEKTLCRTQSQETDTKKILRKKRKLVLLDERKFLDTVQTFLHANFLACFVFEADLI